MGKMKELFDLKRNVAYGKARVQDNVNLYLKGESTIEGVTADLKMVRKMQVQLDDYCEAYGIKEEDIPPYDETEE